MAKNNNLTDFLTDVANAIREKKGTTDLINPQDFSSEIASIETGGGTVEEAPLKDVNFMDYDGTNLYSYSWSEALALTELPPLPSHEGLTCLGWNYTLAEIKANGGQCDVGAYYITDDGATRLYITIPAARKKVTLNARSTIGGVTVDWGDGTTQSVSGVGSHTYSQAGDYIIRITSDVNWYLGGSGSAGVFDDYSTSTDYSKSINNILRKVEIGANLYQLSTGVFAECYSLETVTFAPLTSSAGISMVNGNAFYRCQALKALVFPPNTRLDAMSICHDCVNLRKISIPPSLITTIGESTFHNCYTLRRLVLPATLTQLGASALYECRSLVEIQLPLALTTIENSALMRCISLTQVVFPATIMTIGNYVFQNCGDVAIYDFTAAQAVPTLGSSAFVKYADDVLIKVPSSLLAKWKSATNWSDMSGKIVAG